MLITYGSSSEALARSVAKGTNIPIVESTRRLFPDGEQYVQVSGDLSGEDVVLIHSFALRPDALLVEYFLLVDAIKSAGCRSLTVVIPYFAYLRQDSRFKMGEPLSAKVIASLIESPKIDRIITIDAHLHRFRSLSDLFRTPSLNLSAMPLLADYYLKNFGNLNTVVVGPDEESEQWVRVVAERLSSPYTIMEKVRLGDREVSVRGSTSVRGKTVVLVDDIISTGMTLVKVIRMLLDEGAKKVDALVTHALMVEDSYQKLKEAGLDNLISTDTVPSPHSKVSVAPLISRIIKSLS
ncbi:MAG: ribose-phosphate diphosphokinase [Candidatus Methanomethyliaceae archaeon]|nr:ribose-phosphate diphosphokinase [Candidatus Methanomethyliaceae archaeon]